VVAAYRQVRARSGNHTLRLGIAIPFWFDGEAGNPAPVPSTAPPATSAASSTICARWTPAAGWLAPGVAVPYFWFFEALSPLVELSGYLIVAVGAFTAFIEFVGYRQFLVLERTLATVQVPFKKGQWGKMRRQGAAAVAAPAEGPTLTAPRP
jgi:hypothetical protein